MINIKKYAAVLVMVLPLTCSLAFADISNDELLFFDRLNQVRTAPYSYAIELGYTEEFLATRQIFPETKFDPYVMDEYLNSKSLSINSDIIEDDIIESLDPVFLLTAEKTGMVSFNNFMSPERAAKIFIENQFKKELDEGSFQYILAKGYVYAGVSIRPGRTEDFKNAWFFNITLGSSVLKSEARLLNLINLIRSEPLEIQAYTGKDLFDILSENVNVWYLLSLEYPPLFWEPSLHLAARADVYCRVHGYCPEPETGTTGMTPLEKSLYYGYTGQYVQQSFVMIESPKNNGAVCANDLFSAMMLKELKTWPHEAAIFSWNLKDLGPGISFTVREDKQEAGLSLYAGIRVGNDGNQTDAPQIARIYGLLFMDKDGNTHYSPDEEMAKVSITVFNEEFEPVNNSVTDNVGHFSVILDPGRYYYFKAESDRVSVMEKIFINRDRFVKLVALPLSF